MKLKTVLAKDAYVQLRTIGCDIGERANIDVDSVAARYFLRPTGLYRSWQVFSAAIRTKVDKTKWY